MTYTQGPTGKPASPATNQNHKQNVTTTMINHRGRVSLRKTALGPHPIFKRQEPLEK